VIPARILAFTIQAGAETRIYNLYPYLIKSKIVQVVIVEGGPLALIVRRASYVFENGEVSINHVATGDLIKGAGSFRQYVTHKFGDGSTIIKRSQGTVGTPAAGSYTAGGWTSEIIEGTGCLSWIQGRK
jgi:hypothetical protein